MLVQQNLYMGQQKIGSTINEISMSFTGYFKTYHQ